MKLNPQQAPLYGRCVLTVQLTEEEVAADDGHVDYFLLFVGSTQRHLTSTLRSNHDTLQALCPAHDCCEVVLVTLCSFSPCVLKAPEDHRACLGHANPLAEHRFSFVQDLAFDMAQFLVSTAGRTDGLDGALLLDECRIPLEECERLDEGLALALHHLVLPPGWSLMGRKVTKSTELNPHETLLHFAARRGLCQVANFLLQQSGAREALRLANREGHTPSAIAALRGHERLHQLLKKAETESESNNSGETVQLACTNARIVCHLPRLNTHTLTVSVHPGHDPPTLQKSVEQLLRLICHLKDKGLSTLELHSDSLHAAAECYDGIAAEISNLDPLQQPDQATHCLETPTGGSLIENYSAECNSSVDCGYSETGKEHKDFVLPVKVLKSQAGLQEHGLGPLEDGVCHSSNTGRESCRTEEEGREPPISTPNLNLFNRSEGAQCELGRQTLTVGNLPPAGCGKQAEDTDRLEIQEGQEAATGEEASEQEAENCKARRREKETDSAELLPVSIDLEASNMGQHSSSEGSISEMKETCQDGGNTGKEIAKDCQNLCGELCLDKGLPVPVSPPGEEPCPLIEGGDVITGPGSPVPHRLIQGLHEGEPPPDINSLEQTQETAVKDYAMEQEWDLDPQTGCHSGSCSEPDSVQELIVENAPEAPGCYPEHSLSPDISDVQTFGNSMEEKNTETPLETMPNIGSIHAEPDSGMTHGRSGDDDCSVQPTGSSTTEIFHPAENCVCTGDRDYFEPNEAAESSKEEKLDEQNDPKPDESMLDVGVGLPLKLDSALKSCKQFDSQFDSEVSHSLQTIKSEMTGEEPEQEPSKDDMRLDPVIEVTEVIEAKSEESRCSECNTGTDLLESEVTEASSVVSETREVISPGEENLQPTDISNNLPLENEDPTQDTSEITLDDKPPDEKLILSEDVTLPLDNTEMDMEPPSMKNPAPREQRVDNLSTDNPKIPDTLDGALQSVIQEVEDIRCEDVAVDAGKEEPGEAAQTDSSTIHQDRELYHQPCSTLLSGPSRTSESPSSSTSCCPSRGHRDSGSDTENFLCAEPGYDCIFRKHDEPITAGGDSTSEVSVSCSSTDDTASVCPSSSSLDGSQGLECSWSPVETGASGIIGSGCDGGGGGEAEEAKDRVTEVPRRPSLYRSSIRSLSPLRRHSWGPGKNNGGNTEMNQRSYSLEGLTVGQEELRGHATKGPRILESLNMPQQDSDDRGSLVSLTEEQEKLVEHRSLQDLKSRRYRPLRNSCPPMTLPLTKSVSMLAISQRDIDAVGRLRRKRRISISFSLSPLLTKSKSQFIYGGSSSSDDEDNLSMRSFSSNSGSLAYSISEEEPGPLRSDTEGKSVTKVSRTFSYLKSKMYKKTREKDKEKKDKEKDAKEKEKKVVNGHQFTPVGSVQGSQCSQCNKALNSKDAFHCTHCSASVHKGCRDSLPACAKVKIKLPKQQHTVPDSSSAPAVMMRNKSGGTKERPWSAILSPEDHSSLTLPSSRRPTSIMAFHGNNLSKSLSIHNIAGPMFDEMPIKGLRYLSQSTDSLNRTNQVTESMESLTDEGTEMMDGQLMGEFEAEAKELEADSWSLGVEQQYLQQLDRELVKRQDVIYELMQTEMHHIRTLRIMSEVYSKGLQKELQLELQTVEKLFPVLDELLDFHTQHLLRLLERKRESQLERGNLDGGIIISRIGDLLVNQFSGSNGETMKRVYGRFCSRHSEAVNFYKDLLTKDKRFKAFIKKKMSSSIVRRLGIPECILLVTQRITKYPVLIQRLLQHTKEGEEDYEDLTESVRLVKEVIAVVDSKVNEHEQRRRLKEFHARMDSKSIMMMKSGQIFAKEDLLRRRLIHDGVLHLKSNQARLKEVHALLLSDVFVFLQEKDQKYIFAMLDQRSTVISLQKLIVREVANEERGLFLITAGIAKPEMMEVLASTKDERNTWMQLIQDAMQSMEKDEDEGIPSETEDDKRQLETKAKEMRDLLKQKDSEIMSLLEEKVQLFRGMWEGLNPGEDVCRQVEPFFRSACSQEPPRGASVLNNALQEVEKLQALVNGSLGGVIASIQEGPTGPVCLPRRAETFGGFDSHQMHSSKSGDKDECEDSVGDLRRTESDSVLKKGGNASVQLLKRNSEQVLSSVSNLHFLLSTLQAVVVQQDSFIEEQRQALSERSSSCSSLSRTGSRPSSLIEQEKQRSLEKQRQELASLQRQQTAHAEERRRREREWELREQQLTEREGLVQMQEEEVQKQQQQLQEDRQEWQRKKEEYQKDLERLRDAQRKLERDKEAVQRQFDKMGDVRLSERTPSTTSEESQFPGSSQSLELDPLELPPSSSSSLPRLQPLRCKPKGKGLNPFSLSSTTPSLKASEGNNQMSKGLLQLAKNKSKEGKKKKKSKGGSAQTADPQHLPEPPLDGEIFFC
ncbi:A-kinase anchor protein 13 isoform X5 [Takifugu flavidus]|uniref:A-kinase anchor protein 13 isoform X5 n=1 Tax=Takifugu flavidus TaxID=433684 RepID=UPI00254496DC|nr:A-kinase anchor protein 13 isoform X5 [Takifugu flavidus]